LLPIAGGALPVKKPTDARRAARDICLHSTSGGPLMARHDGMWRVTSIIRAGQMPSPLDGKEGSWLSHCAGSILGKRLPTTMALNIGNSFSTTAAAAVQHASEEKLCGARGHGCAAHWRLQRSLG